MVFSDGLTKANRLMELQFLFHRHPQRALTSGDISRALDIAPRTARKYIRDLSATGRLPVVRHGRGWRLTEGARLETLPVRFQLEEAAALFLAARLLAAEVDEPNRAVRDALTRLACVMPTEVRSAFATIAERVPAAEDRTASVFSAFAYGWALRRTVSVRYESRSHPGKPSTCDFAPYLLATVPASRALYAIGRAEPPGELRVLKLERVTKADLTERTFEAPELEPLLDRIDTAWGIWLGDGEPTEVVLRFDKQVATRARESRWHPSQRLAVNADGTVDMTLRVASTVELKPWILGWGSHCRVLAPKELATEVAREHKEAAAGYESRSPVLGGGPSADGDCPMVGSVVGSNTAPPHENGGSS